MFESIPKLPLNLQGKQIQIIFKRLNMFLVPINMSTFHFSPSTKFLQFLVPQKFSIFTFGPSFKVNSYVEFIFLNKIL